MILNTVGLPACVFVPGEAQPKGSTRAYIVKGHARVTADNKNTKPWQAIVAAFVRAATGPTIAIPEGPVALGMEFVLKRRAAEPKRVTPPHTRKPDLDKLARAVMDGLKGLVYADDNQVTHIPLLVKRTAEIGEQPGVHIWWGTPDEFEEI